MALSVTHTLVSTVADGSDNTLVQPSDWNAAHTVSGTVAATDVTGTFSTTSLTGTFASSDITGTFSSSDIDFTYGITSTSTSLSISLASTAFKLGFDSNVGSMIIASQSASVTPTFLNGLRPNILQINDFRSSGASSSRVQAICINGYSTVESDAAASSITFIRTRANTPGGGGASAALANFDVAGQIEFWGATGAATGATNSFHSMATIRCVADTTGTFNTLSGPGALEFETGIGTPRTHMRLDKRGGLAIGIDPLQVSNGQGDGGNFAYLQIQDEGGNFNALNIHRYGNTIDSEYSEASSIFFSKTASTTPGSPGAVSNGDILGKMQWFGSDGTLTGTSPRNCEAASIIVTVSSTVGENNMAGKFSFRTSSSSTVYPTTPLERMTIAKDGKVTIGTTSGSTGGLTVTSSSTLGTQILFANLPSTDPGVTGRLWNNAGTVKIST